MGRQPGMSNEQLLDALRVLARNIEIKHEHVVRHEPIQQPASAILVIKRDDGSVAGNWVINVGPRAITLLTIPLSYLDPKASPAAKAELEFQWAR